MVTPLRIVVCGLGRSEAARAARLVADGAEVRELSDVEAAMALRDGMADLLIGVCQSGAGAALAMAVGLVGRDRTMIASRMGRSIESEEIATGITSGKVAFGVAIDQIDVAVPRIVRARLAADRG